MSDLISRQDAIDAIDEMIRMDNAPSVIAYNHGIADSIARIKYLPSAEPETHDKGFICPENRKCMCFQCDSKDCEHWTSEIPNIPTYHMNGELVETPDKRTETHPCDCDRVVESFPSAQPEIIRCKDCKHRYVDGENVRFNVCELNHNKVQSDDWFCADAERREDAEIH